MSEPLMIIDANNTLQPIVSALQNSLSHSVIRVGSGAEALHWLHTGSHPQPVVVLLCTDTDSADDQLFLRRVKELKPQLPVIALLPYGHDEHALKLMKDGAHDYVTRPVAMERLKATIDNTLKMRRLRQYNQWLERRVVGHVDFSDIIGAQPLLTEAIRIGKQAAQVMAPVWIEGESGTGKELMARAIHGASSRAAKPFVTVNCAVLSEQAPGAMLFGQERSPHNEQPYIMGKLREAEGGTLYLDEIGALNPTIQQRLYEWLKTGAITPAGAANPLKVDVRVISGSTMPFEVLMTKDSTHPGLYQKLKSFMIAVPALWQRKEDIRVLAEHFLAMHAAAEQKYIRGLTPAAMEWLQTQPWPGNVHALSTALQRAVILCRKEQIDVAELQASLPEETTPYNWSSNVVSVSGWLDAQGRVKPLKSVQEEAIRFALEYANGCMTHAAKSLGIGRSTLYRKLGEFSREAYTSRANQTSRPIMKISSADRS